MAGILVWFTGLFQRETSAGTSPPLISELSNAPAEGM
jgi:hypothetical protein